MKADSLKVQEVFSNGGSIHYVLPHFQREYRWDQGDWQTLWDDVIATYEVMPQVIGTQAPAPEHFLGSLVVVEDGTENMVPVFRLVDGQQRLISLSLLLCALGREARNSHPEVSEGVRTYLFNSKKGSLRFKLLPTTKSGDRDAFCAVLEGKPVPSCRSLVPHAFAFFEKKLQEEIRDGRDPEVLFEVLVLALQVVFITIQDNENPHGIFESLNAKGRPLEQADLVRNYIAMRLKSQEQERVFNANWAPIEEMLSDQREVGRMGELTAFLRHYDALQMRSLGSEKHIYARFRDVMKPKSDRDFVTELERLQRFARHYNAFLRPQNQSDPALREALEQLLKLDVSTVYPFLLAVADAHEQGQVSMVQWIEACGVLENFLLRRLLLGSSSNDMNKIAARLWSDLDPGNLIPSLREALARYRYPSDERLRAALPMTKVYAANAARRRTVLVLDRINRHLSRGSDAYTVLAGAATIEHILPQTLSPEWKHDLGEEADAISREWSDTIGNLTLVTGEHNNALSNAPFASKKVKLAAHGLKLNSAYFGERDIAIWDDEAIRERGEWLCEKIIEVWPSFAPERGGRSAKAEVGEQWPVLLTINGRNWPVTSWRDVMRRVGDFLVEGNADFERLHLAAPSVIRREEFPFANYALSNGWHLNINHSGANMKRHATTLLGAVGISADQWQIEMKSGASA